MSDDLEILTQAWDAVALVLGRHTEPEIRRPLTRASTNIEIASRAIRSTPGSRGAAPLPPKESSATMTASTTTPGDTGFLPDGTRVRDDQGRLGTVVSRNWATADTHERVLFDHSRIILRFRRDSLVIATPRDTGYTDPASHSNRRFRRIPAEPPAPPTEDVPLHGLCGRKLPGCGWVVRSWSFGLGRYEACSLDNHTGQARMFTLNSDGTVTVQRETGE